MPIPEARAQARPQPRPETRYLAFQCFTGAPDPAVAIGGSGLHPLGPMPSRPQLTAFVQDLVHRVGRVGNPRNRLAVIFGPLAFDHSDAEVTRFIEGAFTVAVQQKVAVGFHLDDSMFWARRSDLWRNPDNIEWLDWNGTPTTGRRIDWGPQPQKLPPQMCFNSPAIRKEVRRRGREVFGKAIRAGLDRLRRMGKTDLFAGVIVGWETQIGRDFDTGRHLGYHALHNRGFRQNRPPRDLDGERENVVEAFITLWCQSLAEAGIPSERIYSHTAFLSRRLYDQTPEPKGSYSQQNHFAPPRVAFGRYRRPGFSTYPHAGLFEQIDAERARHRSGAWASSEGTNIQPGSGPGSSGMTMETYLAKMFNHGATLVNIFAWGIGGEAQRHNPFRLVTEGKEALRAYRKFLQGGRLREARSTGPSLQERLLGKVRRIQRELPAWVQQTGEQARVEPLVRQLDAALKANDLTAAEKAADEILKLLPER